MANFKCFQCSQEIVFDAEHIGKNGKKIPLDPATKTPHDCPMREKNCPDCGDKITHRMELGKLAPINPDGTYHLCRDSSEKDDHGNELIESPKELYQRIVETNQTGHISTGYVDHTLKGQQRFKAFSDSSADALTRHADQWIDENSEFMRVKLIGQLQLSADGKTFAIALYYEEVAKQ